MTHVTFDECHHLLAKSYLRIFQTLLASPHLRYPSREREGGSDRWGWGGREKEGGLAKSYLRIFPRLLASPRLRCPPRHLTTYMIPPIEYFFIQPI